MNYYAFLMRLHICLATFVLWRHAAMRVEYRISSLGQGAHPHLVAGQSCHVCKVSALCPVGHSARAGLRDRLVSYGRKLVTAGIGMAAYRGGA